MRPMVQGDPPQSTSAEFHAVAPGRMRVSECHHAAGGPGSLRVVAGRHKVRRDGVHSRRDLPHGIRSPLSRGGAKPSRVRRWLLDRRTPVTNRQFKKFVDATGHVTEAQIVPDPRDYPGVLREMLYAGSAGVLAAAARHGSHQLEPVVDLHARRQLAPSLWARQQYQRPRRPSRRPRLL